LYTDRTCIEFGFVRLIFAIFPARAQSIAAVRDRVRIAKQRAYVSQARTFRYFLYLQYAAILQIWKCKFGYSRTEHDIE
jgi:hypothetical protein